MAIAMFNGIPIPKIYEYREERQMVEDAARTAGGKERRDVASEAKRTWSVRTRLVPIHEVDALESHLDAIYWGYGEWWIRDFGAPENTVTCKVDWRSWRKEPDLAHPDKRRLSFTVIEQ